MTLGLRKVLIVGLVAGIVLVANLLVVASWLNQVGVIEAAQGIREEFLTGTAITIILALLILIVSPRFRASNLLLGMRQSHLELPPRSTHERFATVPERFSVAVRPVDTQITADGRRSLSRVFAPSDALEQLWVLGEGLADDIAEVGALGLVAGLLDCRDHLRRVHRPTLQHTPKHSGEAFAAFAPTCLPNS